MFLGYQRMTFCKQRIDQLAVQGLLRQSSVQVPPDDQPPRLEPLRRNLHDPVGEGRDVIHLIVFDGERGVEPDGQLGDLFLLKFLN